MRQSRRLFPMHPKPGFTALEVLVATTLASLMMVAVLGVLGGIAKKERLLAERAERMLPWQRQFAHRLSRDLESCSTIQFDGESIVLTGFGGRRSGMPTWEPVDIHYWIAKVADQNALLRQVQPRIQPSQPFRAEIFCLGIDKFVVVPDGVTQPSAVDASSLKRVELPQRLRVQLFSGGKIIFDEAMLTNG